jgi:hypothetical protein|tara:strand:- start:798 stop:1061 length:264 start_codon:yes stop_codon:yes gene_type:complete
LPASHDALEIHDPGAERIFRVVVNVGSEKRGKASVKATTGGKGETKFCLSGGTTTSREGASEVNFERGRTGIRPGRINRYWGVNDRR